MYIIHEYSPSSFTSRDISTIKVCFYLIYSYILFCIILCAIGLKNRSSNSIRPLINIFKQIFDRT
ncbi:hypothetical protein HanPI659440_Chr06g0241471 [Helianthus annuus]|nr:hypothetical protein HanPI659440_Chr06g0241471 [Helianthus annuus]